jgi:hypothetical protein
VQVTPDDIIPVLALHYGRRTSTVVHAFVPGTGVTYAPVASPDTPLGWDDLHNLGLDERTLHRLAFGNLNAMIDTARLHGSPPALMASFHGIESSLLLSDVFWAEIVPDLPGTPVVAVPARDVLVITGSRSPAGLAKAHRCVERVMFAGPHNSLVSDLLERRGNRWYVFDESPPVVAEEPAGSWDDQYEAGYQRWSTPEDRTIAPRQQRYDGRPNYA